METEELFVKNLFFFFSSLNLYRVHTLIRLDIYNNRNNSNKKKQRITTKQRTWMTVLRTLLEVLGTRIAGHTC